MPRKDCSAFGVRPRLGREDPPVGITRSEWMRRLLREGLAPREIIERTGATWDHYHSALRHDGRRGRRAPKCPACGRDVRRFKKNVYYHIEGPANVLAGECAPIVLQLPTKLAADSLPKLPVANAPLPETWTQNAAE